MRKTAIQWAESAIRLSGKLFNRRDFPMVVFPLEQLSKRQPLTLLVRGSAQGCKTLLCTLYALWCSFFRPCQFGWYTPSDDFSQNWAEEKLTPLVAEHLNLLPALSDSPRANKRLAKQFTQGYLRIYSGATEADRQQKSLDKIVVDEPWLLDQKHPSALPEIRNRQTGFPDSYQLILATTGEDEGGGVHEIWEDACQYAWHVPCDSCGQPMDYDFFRPTPVSTNAVHDPKKGVIETVDGVEMFRPFGGLHWESGAEVRTEDDRIDWQALAKTIAYQCPHCGHMHPWDRAAQQDRNVAALERVGEHGYVRLNPGAGDREVIACTYNALAHVAWPRLVQDWIKAQRALRNGSTAPFEAFYRMRLARPWSPRHLPLNEKQVVTTGEYDLAPLSEPFNLQTWWPDATAVFLTVDVQQDHYWFVVRAWSPRPETRLVNCGQLVSESQIIQIAEHYGCRHHGGEIVRHRKTNKYLLGKPCDVALDGNYQPTYVRRLAARHHWLVLRGRDMEEEFRGGDVGRVHDDIRPIDTLEGTGEAGADRYVPEVRIANTPARNQLQTIRQISDPYRVWTTARNAPQVYHQHMRSWVRRLVQRKTDHAEHWKWNKIAKRDDLWWCEKAQIVMASLHNIIGAESMETSEDS